MSRGLVKGRVLFTRGKRLVANVANFGERSIRNLVGKHEGKILLGKPRHRWEDNTKMGPKEVGLRPWTESMWLRREAVSGLLRML